jgi:hypothetical protein
MCALLHLVNKPFIPYRKWRIRQLVALPRKPERYAEKISEVLFGQEPRTEEGLQKKQSIMMGVMNDVRAVLLQEGVESRKLVDDLWRYESKYLPSI